MLYKYTALIYLLSFNLYSQGVKTTQKEFSIKIGVSRVIFPGDANITSLPVINPQDYPVLVQSFSLKEDMINSGSYIVTPTILRLESNQQSNLTIRILNQKSMPNDRETLEWLCVKAIPPKDIIHDSKPSSAPEVMLQLSLNTCNKIFYRPILISENPGKYYSDIKWKKNGQALTVKNSGPFYINFSEVKINNSKITDLEYIAPYSEKTVKTPSYRKTEIQWKVITDNGGISSTYNTSL